MNPELPVFRSRDARFLFLGAAVIGAALVLWIHSLRHAELRGLAPVFSGLFIISDRSAALAMPLAMLVAIFVPTRDWISRLLTAIGDAPWAFAFAIVAAQCAGAVFVYLAHPLSMDEYSPYLQSQAFAAGRLTGQFPPQLIDWLIPAENRNTFLAVSHDTGAVASNYWPSFALLLAPFTKLGIPWACNPVLSGLTVLALHGLARRLFDRAESAGLVMLLTIASPVFWANGISFYSMTAHMLCNAVFLLLLLDATPRRLVLAGLVGSVALTLHNPVPHILFALPWLAWLVTRPDRARTVPWLVAGYLPLFLLLGAGWFWYTQVHLHRGPIDQALINAAGDTAGLAQTFGLPNGWTLLARLIGLAKTWLWATPGLMLFAVAGFARQRGNTQVRLLAASAALTLLGYCFVLFDQGHGWGYRYFHSAWFVLPLLAAALVASVHDSAASPPAAVQLAQAPDVRTFIVACALLYLPIGLAQRVDTVGGFVREILAQAPDDPTQGPRVIFIDPRRMFYGADLIQNDAFLREDVLRMMYRTPEQNAALMQQVFPEYQRVIAVEAGEIWARKATP